MLYLRTGGNGSCKTLLTLFDVRAMQVAENRPVYFVRGRFKLNPDNPILVEEFGWLPIDFAEWEQCEDGAIILCDEVHKDLPKTPPSAALPKHIQNLAEHRARGFDFFLLTQHPMNINEFVRRLVQAPGYHQHFKRVMGGTNTTKVLEWDAVNPQCEKDGSGKSAQITTRKQPKEVYSWYVSATLHTAKVRIPKQLYTLLGCVIAFIAIGYFLYQKFKPVEAAPGGKPAVTSSADVLSVAAPGQGSERKPMTTAEYVAAYQPRVQGLMHTAPVYDKLTEPKRVPVPAACVVTASKGCKCYTQDATPYPAPDPVCREFVAHGVFLAFQPDGDQQRPAEPPKVQQVAQPAVQQLDGLTLIGVLPQAGPAAPEPAPPPPQQRIASAKR